MDKELPFALSPTGADNIKPDNLGQALPLVEKPGRYIGGEVNAIVKDPGKVKLKVALAFPDLYEVGMSHLGLKILYSILNTREDILAERVFAVWPDMEARHRLMGQPLRSLENGLELRSFHMIGFSLQYELCATSVLQILTLGHIPLLSEQRTNKDPIIIGGGPVTSNPAPFSKFFDAFAVGDSEEMILEIADTLIACKGEAMDREATLQRLARVRGVMVPSQLSPGERVKRRIVADLNQSLFPVAPPVPFCETVHDRIGLEVARGCSRGCRFCQAGILYRPVRERNPELVTDLAMRSLSSTGMDEIALLSLSTGDYTQLPGLVRDLTRISSSDKVAISLPSLRTETFDSQVANEIKKVRKTGFTLAPEAGSERLRRVINKGNTEKDLTEALRAAFDAGWKKVKLYFMIGLPTETQEDLDAITQTVRRLSAITGKGRLTVSVSTFVPKAHTPFGWERQITPQQTRQRQDYLAKGLNRIRVRPKFHDPDTSMLEGALARGDHQLWRVILEAFNNGARFDGWQEELRIDLWLDAFEKFGIDPLDYLGERSTVEEQPWEIVDPGVSRDFLIMERERAHREEFTPDCRLGECQGCGVCDFRQIFPRLAPKDSIVSEKQAPEGAGDAIPDDSISRYRLKYEKRHKMRFLSHRDLIRTFHRAFKRAGLSLDYSRGFHPHPKLRFSLPIPLGVESLCEYLDFDLKGPGPEPEQVKQNLAKTLPEGLNPMNLQEIALNDPQISDKIKAVIYRMKIPEIIDSDHPDNMIQRFESAKNFNITRKRKGKERTRDLKLFVRAFEKTDSSLLIKLKVDQAGSVNPLDAFSALTGIGMDDLKTLEITKVDLEFH